MKTIIIGDIHGHDTWKTVLKKEKEWDKVIFLGDYFDSFTVKPCVQVSNFEQILEFKKEDPENVVLILGNHDFHYTAYVGHSRYSGYKTETSTYIDHKLEDLLKEGILQVCYVQDNIWFSHAGFSKTWLRNRKIDTSKEDWWKRVNEKFFKIPQFFGFIKKRDSSPYGDNIYQGPLWIRPNSLLEDKPDGVLQIVGHTYTDSVMVGNGLVLCDCLGKGGYAVIEDGNLLLRNL